MYIYTRTMCVGQGGGVTKSERTLQTTRASTLCAVVHQNMSAETCNTLQQCVAMCCSVLQRVAVDLYVNRNQYREGKKKRSTLSNETY